MKLFLIILEIICILFLVIFALVCIISFIENRRLYIAKYKVNDPLVPKSFSGYRIVHLTDLHNTTFGVDNCKLLAKVKALKPDIIVITGDVLVGIPGTDVYIAAKTMNSLLDIAPVYFSMGNHELRISRYIDKYGDMWERFLNALSPDIHKLFDSSEVIEKNGEHIYLHGVSLTPKLYTRLKDVKMPKKHLTKRFGKCKKDEFHIFLAHNPDYFDDYAKWGAKLTFSGHVHGGIIQVPFLGGVISPKLAIFPKYDKGLFEISDKYMILSGGLGNHTIKFRINNLPEIIHVTLDNSSETKAYKVK